MWQVRSKPVDTLDGFVTDRLRSQILLNVGSNCALRIDDPEVEYLALKPDKIVRKISSLLTLKDTSEVSYPVLYQDTILRKELSAVRQKQDPALRGTDPRWAGKYLLPLGLIGTGIAGIISLFYLRS